MFPGKLLVILSVLAGMVLAACGDRALYAGTCEQQTKQFVSNIFSIVNDELNPMIEEGLQAGPATAGVIAQLEELDARVSELNTPACNPKTEAAKDSMRSYMLEVRNYFSTIAGRALYGEGAVQAQLEKVYESSLAFETALDELRR
jgi:hypothetical protein